MPLITGSGGVGATAAVGLGDGVGTGVAVGTGSAVGVFSTGVDTGRGVGFSTPHASPVKSSIDPAKPISHSL